MKHAREDYNRIQDPIGKIPEDEPVMLLRGQDIFAPEVLIFWAYLAENGGANQEIIDKVRNQAEAMRKWQKDTGCAKIPDLPN